jgi:hypothetical protein
MQKSHQYKEYTYITHDENIFNTQHNNEKQYFVLKHFRNFIEKNLKQFEKNKDNYVKLYDYLDKIGNFMIYIKHANCKYDEILNENDLNLINS